MADRSGSTPFETYSAARARFCSNYRQETSQQARTDAIRHSPLVSLAVKCAVDSLDPKAVAGNNVAIQSGANGNRAPVAPSAIAPTGNAFFGQTNALSLASHHAAPASSMAAQSQSTPSFAFSQPSLQTAPFAQYGTGSPASNIFGAFSVISNGFASGKAAQPQHKRHASTPEDTFSTGNANKAQKSEENTSPANGRLLSDGTQSRSVLFGGTESNTTQTTSSFPASHTHNNGNVTPNLTSSPSVWGADMPRTYAPFGTSANPTPFASGSFTEVPTQPRAFAVPRRISPTHRPVEKDIALPQYGLLGFDSDNCDDEGNPEPILLNTNSPHSVFLCGSQGSGKSYTLSCMLENHLLRDASMGIQKQTIPGFVFHWDTNTSGSIAEAASLCSRGMNVRLLVSWSNYRQMKGLYEGFASKSGGKIEVRPLLFQDTELTVSNIRNLMAFRDSSQGTPLYLEVIQNILRKLGRKSEQFSVRAFLNDLQRENFNRDQNEMLEVRLNILKTFSAVTAPEIVAKDYKGCDKERISQERKNLGLGFSGACIKVERGTLTIIDLSDPFVDASTACALFDICLGIILKRHKEAVTARKISPGLIITLDEAHKFLDKDIASADIFTASLLTTIREQRHNAARVVIATQEPTISEKLLDLCSVSIVHRFNSPAWVNALSGHLGAAS